MRLVLAGLAAGVLLVLVATGCGDAAATGTTAQRSAQSAAKVRAAKAKAARRARLGSGKPVTLAFGGDVHFEGLDGMLASNPGAILGAMAPTLKAADIAMVNLETAVTDRGDPAPKEFTFRAPSTAFEALKLGGVDVATIANNHGMDYGMVGAYDSMAAARSYRFPLLGMGRDEAQAYKPFRETVNGQRIAIIAATQVLDDNLISAWTAGPDKPGLASAKEQQAFLDVVRRVRATADTVVVFLHWGTELEGCPTFVQRSLARKLVAAGADVIVGSHAHVLLGAGHLGKALVDYGLGNFVFYASREETVTSGVLEVTVTGRRVDSYRWVPARISGSIPYPVTGDAEAQAVASWKGLRGCTGLRP